MFAVVKIQLQQTVSSELSASELFLIILSCLLSSASPPPLSSLRLLIPPLRLLTAAMWQVARRQGMKNLVMLEDFVSLVTETVPQFLTERQKSLLLLALRAKVNV